MSINIVQYLKEDDVALCGEALSLSEVKLAQIYLKKEKHIELPEAYWKIIEQMNGVFYDGAVLYGWDSKNKIFRDVLSVNSTLETQKQSEVLILGENEDEYLIFDADDEEFKLIDKADEFVWKHSPKVDLILAILFHI